ncbi:hypothetical protein ACSHT2_33800 [Bradyrhizobium sp. PUT101]|uniref:hypothetical protein n=1 Tax=Bradyrhizobium sp. PUT101 TaxID=3447427 RepID=UPI003F84041F
MNHFSAMLIVAALLSFPSASQQSSSSGVAAQSTTGMSKADDRNPIGFTSTQRQMIAWSIAGIAERQPSPQDFQPKPGRSCGTS